MSPTSGGVCATFLVQIFQRAASDRGSAQGQPRMLLFPKCEYTEGIWQPAPVDAGFSDVATPNIELEFAQCCQQGGSCPRA